MRNYFSVRLAYLLAVIFLGKINNIVAQVAPQLIFDTLMSVHGADWKKSASGEKNFSEIKESLREIIEDSKLYCEKNNLKVTSSYIYQELRENAIISFGHFVQRDQEGKIFSEDQEVFEKIKNRLNQNNTPHTESTFQSWQEGLQNTGTLFAANELIQHFEVINENNESLRLANLRFIQAILLPDWHILSNQADQGQGTKTDYFSYGGNAYRPNLDVPLMERGSSEDWQKLVKKYKKNLEVFERKIGKNNSDFLPIVKELKIHLTKVSFHRKNQYQNSTYLKLSADKGDHHDDHGDSNTMNIKKIPLTVDAKNDQGKIDPSPKHQPESRSLASEGHNRENQNAENSNFFLIGFLFLCILASYFLLVNKRKKEK
ncbi:MAG: hypothetical protein QE271_01550 [Bacteriovoracaceae bacterium]|nr:hypothetical protein [Bacteriovoracaceae bacterium]